jgi:putative pyoverdin transport system ATP-binding/permease protein
MNVIYLLLRSSWSIVVLSVFTGLLSGGSSVKLISLINTAVISGKENISTALFWLFLGLLLVMILSRIASEVLLIHLSQGVISHLRLLLSHQILSSPLHYLEELGSPRLYAALTEDVQSVSSAIYYIPSVFVGVAIVFACLIYLAWLSWTAFLGFLGCLFLGIYSYQFITTKARDPLKLARDEQDRLFQHFQTLIEGTKELKLHFQKYQAFFEEELTPTVQTSRGYNVVGLTIYTLANSWGQLLFFAIIGFLIFGLTHLITFTPQILSGYALTIIFLITPLNSLMGVLPTLTKASVAIQKLESLGLSLSKQSEGKLSDQHNPGSSWKCLELVGVTHTYRQEREDSSFLLGPINLCLHPGEITFIVGGNGSGKSTLAKLLTGLYIPSSGEICLDGQPITDKNRVWYRQHFSAVFSDFYIFERLLGLSNYDLKTRAQDYLVRLQLDHKVQLRDNNNFSTTALSQGQRKRLALLAAYLEDRPIYVFDEWASDQDPVFRKIFYTQLLVELKSRGKAVVVISHDDQYFQNANHLVKLDFGQVVQTEHLHDKHY